MALQSDLINIKSAGTTRAEFDRSAIQTAYVTGIQNIRLIAGFSRKGIFNRPIMINSASQFVSIFGSIDRSLEKKGCFFHRTVLQALASGPVLVLNLHAYKDLTSMAVPVTVYKDGDEANQDDTETTAEGIKVKLNNIFDTSLFFEPSKDLFNKAINNSGAGEGVYMANTATEPITVFVVKNSPEEAGMYNYDVTLENWYNNSYPEIVQEFLDKQEDDEFATTHKMSEFFYTVYAYKGDWTKSIPGKLKEFLNANSKQYGSQAIPVYDEEDKTKVIGYDVKIPVAKASVINKMNAIPGVNLIGAWSGVTIPETQNKSGQNITLAKLVNDDVYTSNLLVSIPEIFYNSSTAKQLPTAVGIQSVKELPVGVVPSGKNTKEQNVAMNVILNTLREEPVNIADGYIIAEDGTVKVAEEGETDGNVWGMTNLFRTLVDRQYVQWRYLVDSFGLGYEPSCKSVYTELCKKRESAFAIINFPSAANVTEFNKNADTLSADYEMLSDKISSGDEIGLPNEESGSTYGGYYFPYVKVYDLGENKPVPPAGLISNLFIEKYKAHTIYKPTAGTTRGVLTGVIEPEVGLIKEDRNYIEPVGINSIIFEYGVGTEVYGNKTAKQSPISSLSSINCRETCIYILDTIESITRNFVFEINDAQTRLKIWTQIDTFLKGLKADGGIYDYILVMDESNNNPEIIDNLFGIIDLSIECAKGMEKIHSRLNVLKTGAIAAGEF